MNTRSIHKLRLATNWALAIVLVASAEVAAVQTEPPCPALEHASATQQMKYLSGDRMSLNPVCIETAIKGLGQERYAPAVGLLVSYLDFKSPTYSMPDGPVIKTQWGYVYQAQLALFEIGSLADEELIR